MKIPQHEVKKIGVFRALQLGDMLNAIPAVRALRYAYPEAEITLIGLPWAASFVKRFSKYFDSFLPFPGYTGLPEQPFNENHYQLFLSKVREDRFDLLLQMQGNGTVVNEMMLQWNATYIAGFHNEQSFVHSPLFLPYPEFGSEIHRHLLLMQHLGLSLHGDHLEFAVTKEDEKEWQELQLFLPSQKYVCVHAGSRGAWRQWPPQHFAKMADYCAEKGWLPVLTGTKDEAAITQQVIEAMHHNAVNLTGRTSLGALALLVKHATCLIANCTGISHIASATKTPSIIISMDGEPQRWSPLNHEIHFVTDWTKEQDFSIPYHQLASLLCQSLT